MKNIKTILKNTAFIGATLLSCSSVFAGNEDRVGSAGATQLLVNPWARSGASADAGVANVNGLEATYTNIAGLAYTDKTQIKFGYTNWLGNAGIRLMSAGIAQKIGSTNVIAVSIQSMNFGDIDLTTEAVPEGGIGVFTPRMNVINFGYAKQFTNSISGGINVKFVSESISNLRANGVAIDAGIRYVTGEKDQFKFGISLKNVGPTMKYKGDGLTEQASYVNTGAVSSLDQRSQQFELPSLLNIGISYDFIFNEQNKLTPMFTYTANSFSYDLYRLGLDYGFAAEKAAFNIRAGYVFERYMFDPNTRTNALTGLTAGFSVDALVGKNRSALGIEYATRLAGTMGFIHTMGLTISLK